MVTLHRGIVLTKNAKDKYFLFCKNQLSMKSNDYLDSTFEMITFNYFMIDKDREKFYIDKWSELKVEPVPRLEKFGNSTITFYLPINRDYQSWGKTLVNLNENLIVMSDKNLFRISNSKDGSSTIEIYKGKMKLHTVIDSYFSENIFIRSLDNIDYYIDTIKNEIVLKTKKLNTKYLTKIKKETRKDPKIITIDIETIKNQAGILVPYCYSMYDGKIKQSFFTESPEQLFNALLRRKYRGYTVYAHNLSNFDLIFIFKYLGQLWIKNGYKITPIFKDNKVISILIKNDKGVSLTFRDSYLILTGSLKNLAETFKCNKKLQEPVLIDENLKEETKKFAQNDYSHYTKDVLLINDFLKWKKLIIIYCENDCLILHQILIKFRKLVYKNWELNIENYPTISSLSYAIFRKNYLIEDTIPITSGKVFTWLKDSYTGGSTDMYVPYGINIRVYDGNALYPSQMKMNKFPCGPIYLFEGDITILDKESTYFIADSTVKTKKDLKIPYLQIHHKINGSLRTISPNGTFEMKIHSPEYYNSLEDYDISIRNGYYFKSEFLFNDFVEELFKQRQSYPKGDPMNFIYKLIMNSLYGRFGMRFINNIQKFVYKKDFFKLTENSNYDIIDFLDLGDCFFVNYVDLLKTNENDHKVCIAIASGVTAYSRVEMTNTFKKGKFGFNLYYSDTDSGFIDGDLPIELIGN
uniref:hypothetical protein n=1 Tax=Lentinus flexipes TaxID=3163629 RepID=UPI002264A3B5|nr:hypothetical protein OSR58_mgp16 [Ganoderma flexipes]UYX56945.1 hypothetical protein [Ganoderma flexipes]